MSTINKLKINKQINILAESHFIKVVGKNIEITLNIKCFHETYDSKIKGTPNEWTHLEARVPKVLQMPQLSL